MEEASPVPLDLRWAAVPQVSLQPETTTLPQRPSDDTFHVFQMAPLGVPYTRSTRRPLSRNTALRSSLQIQTPSLKHLGRLH